MIWNAMNLVWCGSNVLPSARAYYLSNIDQIEYNKIISLASSFEKQTCKAWLVRKCLQNVTSVDVHTV